MITTVPIKNEKDIAVPGKTVLVLGYFDGIHKGHQKLFEVASKASMKDYLPVVVMTFTESPKLALQPYQPELMLHIVNHEEREHKMKWHGVEALFLLDFSSKFASLTGQEFFDTYVRALKPAIIVAGFDYTFGSDKKTADELKDYFDGEIIIVPPVEDEKGKISSTRIRQAILDGDVKEVNHLLGTPLPSRGMASVGKNVTFDGEEPRFEVNIFDFSDDIYGETVMVYWLDRVRDMVKFDSIDELVDQLQKDEEIARNWKGGE